VNGVKGWVYPARHLGLCAALLIPTGEGATTSGNPWQRPSHLSDVSHLKTTQAK
jgi:hypothetical protein